MPNENPKKAFGDKKPPLAQLPLVAQIHGALAFYDGSGKYGYRNWRTNPVEAMTYVEAMLRHARLYENGEEYARDTGVHNLGGVIASASLLLDAAANGVLIDNRVPSKAACDLLHDAEADISRLNAQHKARREAAEADADAKFEASREEGAVKRAQAARALATFEGLVAEVKMANSANVQDYTARLAAARDVVLNMVNGVFPEAAEKVPPGVDWDPQGQDVVVSPPPQPYKWSDGTYHVQPEPWDGPGDTPHNYEADLSQFGGDCRICGHTYAAHNK